MSFLFSSTEEEQIVAIFDIGTGSVGGAIARIPKNKNKIPTIIKSVRTEIITEDNLDFNIFLDDTLKALHTSAKSLYEGMVGAPNEIICVLSSPWYLSETRVVKMTREHSFIFSNKLADDLLHKEISALNISYEKKYKNMDSAPEVIEHNIMGVSLNGYLVDEPIGKRSSSVEMHMAISLSPKFCLDKIRRVISKTFHSIPVSFSSFVMSSYLAVRNKYVTPDSYLLLDIGGEITDVAIITKGILKASLSFPFGKKTFFTYMSTKLDVDLRDAKELFNLYSTNKLSDRKRKKVEPLFQSIEKSWNEAFNECINTLPHILTLPNTIFVTADADIREWFVNIIRNEPYIQSMVPGHKTTIITLEGPEFLTMCSVKDGTCDPYLMVEAIGFMKKNNKK
ncbi:MAG: hypothetical protein KGI58_02975 [Patescibacteria group bacterium]|nr:hypothetical protein [Patescibacteria group bacterium]